MRIDAQLSPDDPDIAERARAAEQAGRHTLWIGESSGDCFLEALHAAHATGTLGIGTAVAIAFARTPMTIAYSSYSLASMSRGRFVLGLGTQVKAHIEGRFGMPWSHPAPRMAEFVRALRAIWSAWQDGTALDFRGEFYSHTLMAPFFTPRPHPWGPPPVYLAGVGELMTQVAGEVADGWIWHAFTTQRYLREVSLPALERGLAGRQDSPGELARTGPAFVTTGRDDAELDAAVHATKKQIAFYASTPAYRAVLDRHGLSELQPELSRLARQGRWDDMTSLIPDRLLHEVSAVGSPAEAGRELRARWADVATSITLYTPYDVAPGALAEVVAAAQG
jgi:probable F420-dependent oxidoreductase